MNTLIGNFKQDLLLLKSEIKTVYTSNNNIEPLYDGPLNPEEYFTCHENGKKKILWLLKEPYGIEESGSSLEDWFSDPEFAQKDKHTLTLKRIAYIFFGILNNKLSDDIDYLNPDMIREMKYIAWVNIQKIPKKDDWKTNDAEIIAAYNNANIRTVLKKQIELLQPDIIICGNTFKIVCDDLLKSDYIGSFGDTDYRIRNQSIVIDAYHPSYYKGENNEKIYINNVLHAVNAGFENLSA
ncbi:MAG: hypothetical protein H7257_05340 [Taibaiella sp.]|nr:hypothetical protein [Taibaiella sp.]